MLGADEFVLQLRHLFFGGVERRAQFVPDPLIVDPALNFAAAVPVPRCRRFSHRLTCTPIFSSSGRVTPSV